MHRQMRLDSWACWEDHNRMSKYFAESNGESSTLLFNKRTVYKGRTINSAPSVKNIVDFNQAERRYFGKVDYHFFTNLYKTKRSDETP